MQELMYGAHMAERMENVIQCLLGLRYHKNKLA